jgi:hypothetical protein
MIYNNCENDYHFIAFAVKSNPLPTLTPHQQAVLDVLNHQVHPLSVQGSGIKNQHITTQCLSIRDSCLIERKLLGEMPLHLLILYRNKYVMV